VAVFVNREVELRLLAELVDRAARGSGVIVSVQGQPGIGKTSLLDVSRVRILGTGVCWP
jgi:predicted ATPase